MSEHTNPASQKPPSVDRLSLLWRRINEHKIVQWSVAYIAVAYGLQHGVILASESLEWPNAVARISILLLVLGLPLVMTFAWYHGARASRNFSQAELSILAALLVMSSLLFYVFVRPSAELASPAAQQAGAAAARSTAADPHGAVSLAVLPFVDLSGDTSQEFFSDGMTEEITAALAQIKGLHVVGRTSAFAFKGRNEDLRSIGRSLGATHLIEGSVRKAGNQLRITAQLIKADDDSHLWAQNYDRELKDVFAVQEDIARAIAASLQAPLGLKQGETLVSGRTGDTESYEDYLRARALFRSRSIKEAIAVLERSVARDPNNAAAWGLLAEAYIFVPAYVQGATDIPVEQARRVNDSSLAKAEAAAREAIRLNPKNASGYSALADVEEGRMRWKEAEDFFRQALELDPDDPDALHMGSLAVLATGKVKQALEMRLRLRTLEPFVPIYNVNTATALLHSGRGDEAVAILESVPNQGGVGTVRDGYLALAYASAGRYAQAADTVLSIPVDQVLVSQPVINEAAKLLREAPAKIPAAQPSGTSRNPIVHFVFAVRGAPVRALDAMDYAIAANWPYSTASMMVWSPVFSEARKTERFKQLARKAGLVDYWRAKGWPDSCRPVGADDFACE